MRYVGTALAVMGGIMMITSALFLPTFSKLTINTHKINTANLTPEQKAILENRTNVLGMDVQQYLGAAGETSEMRGNKDALSNSGILMTLFIWLTVIFGLIVIILGIIGSRRVRSFGYSGIIFGISMLVLVWLIPMISQNYLIAEIGMAPIIALVGGIFIIASSFLFPKKGQTMNSQANAIVSVDFGWAFGMMFFVVFMKNL